MHTVWVVHCHYRWSTQLLAEDILCRKSRGHRLHAELPAGALGFAGQAVHVEAAALEYVPAAQLHWSMCLQHTQSLLQWRTCLQNM